MKRLIVFVLLSIPFWNFKLIKREINTAQEYKETRFVTAKSGLLCRDKPHGKVIHKFAYGTEVEIIATTNQELTITDEGKKVSGYWVEVKIGNTNKSGYVFNGFLTSNTHFDLDVEKIAELAPANFNKIEKTKGLLLKGTHNVYDNDLNVTEQIHINSISDVEILSVTKFERPKKRTEAKRKKWQDYCKWANYVKIIYNNRELIVFGENVYKITSNKKKKFNNSIINFLIADNFLKKTGTLTEELSGCFCGEYFLIKSEGNYSFVYDNNYKGKSSLFFLQNEYGSAGMHNTIIKKDTIFSEVSQSFQEGTGSYKLKIFKNNEWKFIEYDKVRN